MSHSTITFTRVNEEMKETTQVSQILYDNVHVAWIEYDDLNRIIVFIKDDWYYVDGKNITVRNIVESLGYKRCIVTWASYGERYDVLDKLVLKAPQNTIRIFSNPTYYLDYSEYDDLELCI